MSVPAEMMNGFGPGEEVYNQPAPMDSMNLPPSVDGAGLEQGDDGSVTVHLDGEPDTATAEVAFGDNLADTLDESWLTKLGQMVDEWVTVDRQARSDWEQVLKKGLEQVGIGAKKTEGMIIKNASEVIHPLVAEAAIQFQARAIEELFPAGGPAKGVVLGDPTTELQDQGDRVEKYMNYFLTAVDKGYFENTDQMLFCLALAGSAFKKVYVDPVTMRPMSRYVDSLMVHVPYSASTLEDTPRITHEFNMQGNDLKRAVANKVYRKVRNMEVAVTPTATDGTAIKDEADNRQAAYAQDDDVRTMYECACSLELPGSEEIGFGVPCVVTIDKDTKEVLSVRRNWREGDTDYKRQESWVHYRYLPGWGFYGFGILHIIGQLGAAATGLLRIIIDSGARGNFAGGFKSKEARKAGTMSPGLGEWIDVEMAAEDLTKAFFPLPYKEPGPGVFQALGKIEESGQRFAATTEAMVGEAGNSGPVGTTMALIEQGSKVFSGIHKRIHVSMRGELQLLMKLIGKTISGEYPYHIEGMSAKIMASDFNDRIDIAPVSDPAIVSATQRILQAQAGMQVIDANKDLYGEQGRREAHLRLLKALKVPQPERILQKPQPDLPPHLDPASENVRIMGGRPVKAYLDEDHAAHMQVHHLLLQTLQLQSPEIMKKVSPAILAHISEHIGLGQYLQLSQAAGLPFPPLDPATGDPPQLPPQLQDAMAKAAAFGAQKLHVQVAQAVAAQQAPVKSNG